MPCCLVGGYQHAEYQVVSTVPCASWAVLLAGSKTQFMFNNFFFLINCAISEIWKKFVEAERPQMTIQCMCIAC
jgi:hypothetical protein